MSARNWEREYHRVLETDGYARTGGLVHGGPEKRGGPRLAPRNLHATVRDRTGFPVSAISAHGVTLLAERPLAAGLEFGLHVAGGPEAPVRVADCRPEELDAALLEVRYAVRCVFLDPLDGDRLMRRFARHAQQAALAGEDGPG